MPISSAQRKTITASRAICDEIAACSQQAGLIRRRISELESAGGTATAMRAHLAVVVAAEAEAAAKLDALVA